MEHGAWGRPLRIADCGTGNPPEGWESVGQLRIEKKELGDRSQEKKNKKEFLLLAGFWLLTTGYYQFCLGPWALRLAHSLLPQECALCLALFLVVADRLMGWRQETGGSE
jgi:hypothetical protein